MVQTTVIEDLEKIAISHEAVNHKYLIHLKSGGWPNSQIALAYFASQYQYYSDWFPKYLNSTISKLSNEVHRNQLMDNLMEESGHLNESERQALEDLGIEFQWVNGIAHP
ncbi:MAG: cupin domain protein, partial [Bacteroidota bacterium]